MSQNTRLSTAVAERGGGVSETVLKEMLKSYNNRYGPVSHQKQSFELFFGNTLAHIVQENSEVIVKHPESTKTSCFSFRNVNIPKPNVTEASGFTYKLTPADAKARGLTYASPIFVDILQHTYDENGSSDPCTVEKKTFVNVHLATIPVMVGTQYCNTADMFGIENECCYDQGGYFIINGVEKGFVSQEKLRINYPFIFESKGDTFSLTCEIRSCHEKKLRSTSTLYVTASKDLVTNSYCSVNVSIPFIPTPVPLSWAFYMLGVKTIEEVRQFMYDSNDSNQTRTVVEAILAGMKMPTSYEAVVQQLCKRRNEKTREDARAYVNHITMSEVLPHIGIDNSEKTFQKKCWYLGFVVRRIIRVTNGELKYDDRDHYAHKRVDTAGSLMSLLFRQLFRAHLKYITIQLTKYISNARIRNIMEFISNKKITSGFRYAFATGNWGIQKNASTQTGVVQVLSRMTAIGPISSLQRVNTPLCREGKAPEPRQLHRSSWGVVCAAETPEGPSCGLMKNLCTLTHVRLGIDTPLITGAIDSRLTKLDYFASGTPSMHTPSCPVFINGQCLGSVRPANIDEFVQQVRTWRRSSILPFDLSVSFSKSTECIEITSDRGGICRPVFVVSSMHLLQSVVDKFKDITTCLWDELVAEGVIEYIDKEEEDSLIVAMYYKDVVAAGGNEEHHFTHCEIHPTAINGLCAGQIPFSDHNQAPRNCYQSAMGKQAVGVYTSNYLQRMDNMAHVLCHPQRPLVTTWTDELQSTVSLPAGGNAIVAIMCWGGYNQEDSLIVNKTAIDNGMFTSLCYRTYKEEVLPNASDTEVIQPPDPINCTNMKTNNYNKLENSSTPLLETKLEDGDVIIGKTITTRPSQSVGDKDMERRTRDDSTCVKPNERGVTDKTMTVTNGVQFMVKVRTRQVRRVQVGDKLASRHGQKGVVGIVYDEKDMPFTSQGIRPDIIVNPHAIPSRMTIGMLVEMLLGKECLMAGEFGNGTPFRGGSVEQIARALEDHGLERYGREQMFNAYTGEMMESRVFIAPAYYQRLKHMVIDKVHARGRGPVQLLTRQPNEGRSREGGLRMGEMERDCLVAHGCSAVLRECLCEKSDPYVTVACTKCGLLCEPYNDQEDQCPLAKDDDNDKSLMRDSRSDPSHPEGYCRMCKTSKHTTKVRIPYAMKLLIQELQALHIFARLRFNKPNNATPAACDGIQSTDYDGNDISGILKEYKVLQPGFEFV